MIGKRVTLVRAAIAATISLLACGAALASGGVYLDDFQVSNAGKTVLSDNFDDGKISDWKMTSDASVVFDKPNKPPCALLLNKHIFCAAGATHSFSIANPGLVEFSTKIFITPAEEQYDWARKRVGCNLYFTLYSEPRQPGKISAKVATLGVHLYKSEPACRVSLSFDAAGAGSGCGCGCSGGCGSGSGCGCSATSAPSVLPTSRWALLTMRLDPRAGRIYAFVDNRQVLMTLYDATKCSQIADIGISCGFGDGSKRTD